MSSTWLGYVQIERERVFLLGQAEVRSIVARYRLVGAQAPSHGVTLALEAVAIMLIFIRLCLVHACMRAAGRSPVPVHSGAGPCGWV